jgi:ribose-phosphate pyrophosphokinase
VDNVYATPILLGDVWKHSYENLIVVSPDVGGVVRARAMAKRLSATSPSSTSAGRAPTSRRS